jgi:TrmH family RNA methyltransferase
LHPIITSLQNPTVKRIRSLDSRKGRRRNRLFIAEGAKVVATARDRGWPPKFVVAEERVAERGIVAELLDWAAAVGAHCIRTTSEVLSKLSTRDNPQNVIGVFEERWASVAPPGPNDTWIALEHIRDPGNLGTIVRTADAAGASGIILVGACCDPYSREAVRATMGSIFSVPLVPMTVFSLLQRLGNWPGESIGTHLEATTDYRAEYGAPTLLVMGGEGPGLSSEIAKACSRLVKIPMSGHADSLNLAIATALVLFEIRRPLLSLQTS